MMQTISATPKTDKNFQDVEAGVEDVLTDVAENGVTAEELERARSSLLSTTIYAEDSQMYLARMFGSGLATGLSFDEIRTWPQKIATVSLDDVHNAAKVWLARNRSVTGCNIS